MAKEKRFYWIKLKETFFDLETIDWLISQKNGCEYIVLYQKLCLLTANKSGRLEMQVGEMIIPFDINKISRDTKFDIDTVIVAMELFKKIGLIYEEEDGVLKIPYVEEIVGSESSSAQRMRKSRAKKALAEGEKASLCDGNVTQEKREKRKDFRYSNKEVEAVAEATDGNCISDDDKLKPFNKILFFSENQMGHLLELMGLEMFNEYCARLEQFIMNNDADVKSHYKTILKWYKEDCNVEDTTWKDKWR